MPIFNSYFKRDFAPYDRMGAIVRAPQQTMPIANQKQMEHMEQVYLCSAMFWAAVQQIVKPCRAARLKIEKKVGDDWVEDEKNEIGRWWKYGINPEMNGKVWIEAYINHLAVYGIFRNEWTPKGMASPEDRNPDGSPRFTAGMADEPPWLTPIVPYVLVPDIRKDLPLSERQGTSFKMPMITNKWGRLFRYMHATSEDLNFGYPVQLADVFIAKNYNPVRGYVGISPLALVDKILGMGDSLVKHAYSYLHNNGIPSGIVTYAADSQKYQTPTLSPDEKLAVETAYMNMFAQEGDRPNSPAFFPAGIDFKPLAAPIKDLMPAELWDIVQAAVHEVLGTSPTESLVGLRQGNNRASAKSHQTSVWLYTCEPMLEFIGENLGNFLFPRFDQGKQFEDGKVRLGWDYAKVPAYREIQELYNKTLLDAVRDSIAQVNEGRKALGLPEDPEMMGCYLQKQQPIADVPNTADPNADPNADPQNQDPQQRKQLPGKSNVLPIKGVK